MTGAAKLSAELYRLTHRGNPGDIAFYTKLCAEAPRVLELGSGYGRLLGALAHPGRQLVGLENDRALFALGQKSVAALPEATRRGTRLVRGDMRKFEFSHGFERILLPYNGLYCLLGRREALSCFRSVRRALSPGGLFAFDVWNSDAFHEQRLDPSDDGGAEPLFGVSHAKQRFQVFEATAIRKASQRLDVCYAYVPERGDREFHVRLAQRYFLSDELNQLLLRAGFSVVRRYGSFSGQRFSRGAARLVVVAKAR